jgi:Fe-S-cluster containining protein
MEYLIKVKADLDKTLIQKDLEKLFQLYSEAGDKLASFQSECGFSCPQGCGVCCENFEPDVIPQEADFAAVYLIYEKPSLMTLVDRSYTEKQCLFYDPENPDHCTIYPARPLICRLFAFSSVTDKKGDEVFSLCARMPVKEKSHFDADDLGKFFTVRPPVMTEFGARLSCIFPGTFRIGFRKAVKESIYKILNIRRYVQTAAP